MKNSEFLHKHRALLNNFLDVVSNTSIEHFDAPKYLASLDDRERAILGVFGFIIVDLGESMKSSLARHFATHGLGQFGDTMPEDL